MTKSPGAILNARSAARDCNIMVKSETAGKRVMASVTRFVSDSLRLTVNPLKSALDRPAKRKFLGFTFSRNGARLKVADKAIDKLKDRIRELTRRTQGHRLADIVAILGSNGVDQATVNCANAV